MSAVAAFTPVPRPVAAGRFARHCWHIVGDGDHPMAGPLRQGSAPLRAERDGTASFPVGVAVLLGAEFTAADNARLLDGVAAARREGGRLVLVHLGAGGAAILAAAAAEGLVPAVRTIELPPAPGPRVVRVAVALANAEDLAVQQVAVAGDGRITAPSWEPAELPPVPPPGEGSVLITGGLGGLGLRAAAVLSRVRGLRPVLLDTARPADLDRRDRAVLDRLPGDAALCAADLAEPEQVAIALRKLDGPPVRAVVHCAGVLDAGPLAATTAFRLAAVQQVKVDGLRNVLAAMRPEEVRHLVTFGSITAVEPHRGMAAYGLANELLARATVRAATRFPDCATVAAQWSLWSGAGMASRLGAVGQARRMGMRPIPLSAGMTALARLFGWPAGARHACPLVLRGA